MNGFRITLLILLALAVATLLGIVTVFQSSQEANYEAYLAEVKASERRQQLAAHQDRMRRIGPQDEDAPGADVVEATRQREEQSITEEEERNVLASATLKDEARAEAAAREAAAQQAAAPKPEEQPIGLVHSYNKEWGFIMVKPVSDTPMPSGTAIAVQRDGRIVCEADLGEEELDDATGARLISATIRQNQFTQGDGSIPAEKFEPAAGDRVILSPYLSSSELRGNGTSTLPAPLLQEEGQSAAPAGNTSQPQEVDALLIPMP